MKVYGDIVSPTRSVNLKGADAVWAVHNAMKKFPEEDEHGTNLKDGEKRSFKSVELHNSQLHIHKMPEERAS